MPKKRKRLSISAHRPLARWVLWVIFIAVAYIGLDYSHLTDLRIVRVSGSNSGDREMFESEFAKFNQVPAMQVKSDVIQNDIEMNSDIGEATFSRNVFGRGYLSVKNRIPIARIVDTNYAIDKNGSVFPLSLGQTVILPSIRLSKAALKPHVAFLEPYDLAFVANAVSNLQLCWPKNEGVLTLREDGSLYLDRASRGLVNFGGSNDFQAKLTKLKQILDQNPSPFSSPVVLNLVSPTHPAVSKYAPKSIEKSKN